jgi:hypothetical protein
MKKAYRMFKRNDRGGVYYIQENGKNNPKSLGTTDEAEAQKLLDTKNQAVCQTAALNLQLGKVFISNADPKMAARTWQIAMDELCSHGKEVSQKSTLPIKSALASAAFKCMLSGGSRGLTDFPIIREWARRIYDKQQSNLSKFQSDIVLEAQLRQGGLFRPNIF